MFVLNLKENTVIIIIHCDFFEDITRGRKRVVQTRTSRPLLQIDFVTVHISNLWFLL